MFESSLKLSSSLSASQMGRRPPPSSSMTDSPACPPRLALRTDLGIERWLATMEPRCCHTEDCRRGIEMTECLYVKKMSAVRSSLQCLCSRA